MYKVIPKQDIFTIISANSFASRVLASTTASNLYSIPASSAMQNLFSIYMTNVAQQFKGLYTVMSEIEIFSIIQDSASDLLESLYLTYVAWGKPVLPGDLNIGVTQRTVSGNYDGKISTDPFKTNYNIDSTSAQRADASPFQAFLNAATVAAAPKFERLVNALRGCIELVDDELYE